MFVLSKFNCTSVQPLLLAKSFVQQSPILTSRFRLCSSSTSPPPDDNHNNDISSRQEDPFPLLTEACRSRNYMLVSKLINEHDPYELRRAKIPEFTSKHQPTLVPSNSATRMIGCVCEPEADAVNWMELKRDSPPVKCYCGNWFQLVTYEDYFRSSTSGNKNSSTSKENLSSVKV